MDTDNDRLLTKENFQQSMMPVFAHTDLANAVFTAFDTDGNDAIDYKEFARYPSSFPLFLIHLLTHLLQRHEYPHERQRRREDRM